MHAVAVIGYSGSSFYYVDTCSEHSWPNTPLADSTKTTIHCRGSAATGMSVDDSAAQNQSGYANVWKIDAGLMWRLMRQQRMPDGGHLGGYYYFGSNAFLYMRHPVW